MEKNTLGKYTFEHQNLKVVVYGRLVTVQRHRQIGNLKVSLDQHGYPVDQQHGYPGLIGVGSRDAYKSKNLVFTQLSRINYFIAGSDKGMRLLQVVVNYNIL